MKLADDHDDGLRVLRLGKRELSCWVLAYQVQQLFLGHLGSGFLDLFGLLVAHCGIPFSFGAWSIV